MLNMRTILLWCVMGTMCGTLMAATPFRIAAFNVQVFGQTKMSKPEVVDILVKIIRHYDIVLIQEIRDSSGTAIKELLNEVNKGSHQYLMEISERLGRTSSKEQYAYLYRDDVGLSVEGTYQYPDTADIFQREPYAVYFHSAYTSVADFVLAGIHTDPDEAPAEIDGLVQVHDALEAYFDTDHILLMGDFNADCNYVSQRKLDALLLRQDPKYIWLVPDDWDTTVGNTNCAYDRFVMTGSAFVESVVSSSVKISRFDTKYQLTQEQALDVSDHYPIELTLKTTENRLTQPSSGASCVVDSACQSLLAHVTELIELLKGYNKG